MTTSPMQLLPAVDIKADAVFQNTDTDVKEYYDFDNGQRDNFYGISKITIKPGTNFVPTGRLLVKYEFFTHDGTGDFFSVDSYSGLTDDDGNTIGLLNCSTILHILFGDRSGTQKKD